MSYFTVGYRLPGVLSRPLFGDRKRYGLEPKRDDPCWREWERVSLRFYDQNQKQSVGAIVNDAGYRVMRQLDLQGKRVLEIGPGEITHLRFWRGQPEKYVIADVSEAMLERSRIKLSDAKIRFDTILVERGVEGLAQFPDRAFDVIVSFYSLEHLHPLGPYVQAMTRLLRSGGVLVGAIPTEGGLGWGVGRFMTSRRWLKRNTTIDPDKIICWEHPNFADGVLATLNRTMERAHLSFWPLRVPIVDANLIIRFVYAAR